MPFSVVQTFAECPIFQGRRLPSLDHHQGIQYPEGHCRLHPPIYPVAFSISTVHFDSRHYVDLCWIILACSSVHLTPPYILSICFFAVQLLHQGRRPACDLKTSSLVFIRKCKGLYLNNSVNFWPTTSVSFVPKVIDLRLTICWLIPPEFWKGHSTKILLVCLLSYVYGAIDCSQLAILALLLCQCSVLLWGPRDFTRTVTYILWFFCYPTLVFGSFLVSAPFMWSMGLLDHSGSYSIWSF